MLYTMAAMISGSLGVGFYSSSSPPPFESRVSAPKPFCCKAPRMLEKAGVRLQFESLGGFRVEGP